MGTVLIRVMAVTLGLLPLWPGSVASAQEQQPPTDFRVVWEHPVAHRFQSLTITERGALFAIGQEGAVGFDVRTGQEVWRLGTAGAYEMIPREVAGSDLVVFMHRYRQDVSGSPGADPNAYSLTLMDTRARAAVWRTSPAFGLALVHSIGVQQDRLLILVRGANGIGTLFGLSLETGRTVWRYRIGAVAVPDDDAGSSLQVDRYLTIRGDRVYSFDRSETPPTITAHDIASGDLRWIAFLEGEESNEEALRVSTTTASVLVTGTDLYGLDPGSGSIRWRMEDGWKLVDERTPWLLVKRSDSGRLQMVDDETGRARWDRPLRYNAGPPSAALWGSAGVLVGEPEGRSLLFEAGSGDRRQRGDRLYRVSGRRELQWVLAVPDGLLYVHAGETATRIIAAGPRAETAWEVTMGNLPTVGRGPAEPSEHLLRLISTADPRNPGALWIITRRADGPSLTAVDLRDGSLSGSAPIGATNPLFVVDAGNRRIYYVDQLRNLVGAGY
jgi:outer membrane protein assembly factor BamB